MNDYFRITGYCEEQNCCFIMDCYGAFGKLWQFSSYLLQKGLKVLKVGNDTKFLGVEGKNKIKPIELNAEKIMLRANAIGKPEYITQTLNGTKYKVVKVADKIYIPDKSKLL